MDSTAGHLLIASPLMGDPNFARSVVLMIEHSADGAIGVVLNSPSRTTVADMLPPWEGLASRPSVFFMGGPVSPEAVLCLGAALGGAAENFRAVIGNVGMIDLNRSPDELDLELEEIRVFAGYSGWGPKQLETELAADAWFVVDADPHDAFMTEPDELWSFVLARQRGPMAWLSNYPIDPRMN
ncbi:MAG: YqgE/AlgH family protein [Acidimicrobiales bacterium]